MKEIYYKNDYKKFKNYFNIKSNPSICDIELLEKTKKYSKYFNLIPWIEMIWVWNSISMNCSDKNSDIDLYIVTKQNYMWFVRIFMTLFLFILFEKKTKNNHAKKFCLSFFSTKNWMDFKKWKIEKDIYLYFWIVYFKPILVNNDCYNDFIKINSLWADFSPYYHIIKENEKNIFLKNNKNFSWVFIEKLNYLLEKIFFKKTYSTYKKLNYPYWVIINKDLLKFHDNDIRKKVRDELI